MARLDALVMESERRQMDTEYIATILWSIGRMVGGDNYPMPTYDEYNHPQPVDVRGTEQIVGGLISKLTGGGASE